MKLKYVKRDTWGKGSNYIKQLACSTLPKTNNSFLKNDDLGDYFGNPKPLGLGIGRGLTFAWSFMQTLRSRQENYTKMLQEKDLLLESQDLCGKYSPENER